VKRKEEANKRCNGEKRVRFLKAEELGRVRRKETKKGLTEGGIESIIIGKGEGKNADQRREKIKK